MWWSVKNPVFMSIKIELLGLWPFKNYIDIFFFFIKSTWIFILLVLVVQNVKIWCYVVVSNAHNCVVVPLVLCCSIFTEERLERLTKEISNLDFELPVDYDLVENSEDQSSTLPPEDGVVKMQNGTAEATKSSTSDFISSNVHDVSQFEAESLHQDSLSKEGSNGNVVPLDPEIQKLPSVEEPVVDSSANENFTTNQSPDMHLPNSLSPLRRYQHCESPDSSSR